ncbi:hypothetical protein [Haliovirga abyssi]|uniref:TonB-dependent receptor n=1 Tax=Haliovirga abyssi TaxID=2996794 RepID=A0AAU9DQ08_9FUSO|nr:hypothetical protein [Haliovirga abyssi]BDU50548.1 hypothetical protein HLVA_11170 [Haliovirga abyssi]
MKKVLIILFIVISNLALALKLEIKDMITYEKSSYNSTNFILNHSNENFSFYFDLDYINNDKYKFGEERYNFGYYHILNQGFFNIKLNKNVSVKLGRMYHNDVINTPYTLFISSEKQGISGIQIKYSDEKFFFETNWFQLNVLSDLGYPDRGANYRVYGINLSDEWRFGYQESVVYTGRSFDFNYFTNPIPAYMSQSFYNDTNAPWKQYTNENSIMGLFLDRKRKNDYFCSQLLIDDMNWDWIFSPKSKNQNPNKMAWSIGYKKAIKNIGKIGIYNAGSTKYTFEPMGNGTYDKATNTQYGYTYYPDNKYYGNDLNYIDNYIGYKYGENNIAFLVDFEKEINKINLYTSFEYVVSGSKSPENPWHEYTNYSQGGEGTKFLNDKKLEKTLNFSLKLNKNMGKYTLLGGVKLGRIINKLELKEIEEDKKTVGNNIRIYRPSDEIENSFELNIGIEYRF